MAAAGASDGSERPLFVVGAPRSGTTMLRYMLSSHPRIYIPPESNFIPRFFRHRPHEPLSRERALHVLLQIGDYRVFWRDWTDPPLDAGAFLDDLPDLTPASLIDGLYRRYARQYGAVRWGDKSPMYADYVELLAELFPDGQVVHIVRDGRDVTTSSLQAYQGRRFFYMDPYYLARTWRDRVEHAMAAGKQLGAGRYHELRYEELTAEPERVLRRVCDFLGEEFHPPMATPAHEARRHHHSKGIHHGVRSAVNTRSTGRWQSDLSPADQRLVQAVAGDVLERLAYPMVELGPTSTAERVRAKALQGKYVVLHAGRSVLQNGGVFHPTDLLARRHRKRRRPPAVVGA